MKLRFDRFKLLLVLLDALIINCSFLFAFFIRFDGQIPFEYLQSYLLAAVPITIINISIFYLFGLYGQIWAYASINALLSIAYAVSLGSVLGFVISYLTGLLRFPYSVLVIAWLFKLLLVGGSRFIWRIWRETIFTGIQSDSGKKRVLILGAGDAGETILREMIRGQTEYLPIGLLDDDAAKKGLAIHGIKVLGSRADIPRLAKKEKIKEVIITMPSASGKEIDGIIRICRQAGVKYKTLPPIYELIDGNVSISNIRELREEDLLGRKPIKFDLDEVKPGLEGKVVVVTGAGGSIGSELCRQISYCNPRKLILLGQGESSIYQIDLELREKKPSYELIPVIANIRDEGRIDEILSKFLPEIVFHAAAYKHVSLMEQNPAEAYKNNVWGTKVVAEAALKYGVGHFVLISTDKAVQPVSEMGRTKRDAERLVLGLQGKGKTKFMVTRFGNVMNSRGSVIPLFKRQIAQGRSLTVTHPDVVRFFMTIPEAVQLVLRAAMIGEGGEIFVLDIGEPKKISDLAKELVMLSGLEPGKDVPLEFVGLKPGEKMTESLFDIYEEVSNTSHKHILKVVKRKEPLSKLA
ncbi:MAG: nucleoside-diphosphate sugar epimerase/dehydratase [Candidatus Margulisiibacteriota bacterium]